VSKRERTPVKSTFFPDCLQPTRGGGCLTPPCLTIMGKDPCTQTLKKGGLNAGSPLLGFMFISCHFIRALCYISELGAKKERQDGVPNKCAVDLQAGSEFTVALYVQYGNVFVSERAGERGEECTRKVKPLYARTHACIYLN
jgi:hypothetical protein